MRLILIDNHSGFIFGDTAQLDRSHAFAADGPPSDEFRAGDLAKNCPVSPIMAAQWSDESLVREFGRIYRQHGPDYRPASNESAYHVFRADPDGSDAVPPVWEGWDPETIAAVERDCRKIAVVTWSSAG